VSFKAGLTVFAKEENIKYLQVYQFIQHDKITNSTPPFTV
jgi:hypothetical protein